MGESGQMSPPQNAVRDHEYNKYLELVPVTSAGTRSHRTDTGAFTFVLPELSPLRDALDTHVELLRFRLGAKGAFVVLTDGNSPHFLAGTHEPDDEGRSPLSDASWLGSGDADLRQWVWIFQQTLSIKQRPAPRKDRVFTIESLAEHERSSKLSSVCRRPHLSFYAGTPICCKQGVAIGAVFIVDSSARLGLSSLAAELLTATAEKCAKQLESARQCAGQDRWKRMSDQLTRFVGSRVIRDQLLEEPPSLGRSNQKQRKRDEIEEVRALALRHDQDPSKADNVALPEAKFSQGPESRRTQHAEAEQNERIVKEDEAYNARTITGQPDNARKQKEEQGETTYRKVFRRAAECLQEALQADGVLFIDGLIGYHGAVHATGQTEGELQHEMATRPHRESIPEDISGRDPPRQDENRPTADAPLPDHGKNKENDNAHSRTYTSPEYLRGVLVEHPAEILGISMRDPSVAPNTKKLKESTLGLSTVDEGRLQMLMDRYPDGAVWYVQDSKSIYLVQNDSLVKEDTLEETRRLVANFPGVRQIIFRNLTDPVSLKRLAGCVAWSTHTSPLFTDTTDAPSLRGFLHVIESEISRIDAAAAVKQKEAFVSSVSHELRTPLHGILGSVQLLADTRLDAFQTGLAETIKTSGSTLNETLTSVLSYAKINQFERQQHKYRQRRPPDEDWSLPNKMHLPPGPQTEYEGLYVGTNVALLCEEVAGVLEAGQSYDKLTDPGSVTVVLEVRYEDNWNYYTEPGALRRTAVNIIGNALKYTKKGQVTITLSSSEIKAEEMDLGGDNASRRMIDLIVKDTGKGMSKEFMENHLFVPFTQEDSTSSYGVGLGMSIVKGLVTLLSGEIQVKSEQGKGTEVTISMPMRRYEPDPEELEQSTADLERRISTIRGEHLSVVLFGFPSHVRRCLETYLSEWFHCEILESADDAEPDVVVVDEGNPEVADAVERTAERYGRRGVLLSIAMIADTLAKPMRPIKGYHKWERIPRPIGPSNLGKALTACVKKLRELREPGANDGTGEHYHGEDVPDKAYKGWRDGDQSTREGASSTYPRKKEDEPPKSTHIPHERPLPIRTRSFAPSTSSKDSSIDPSNLRVLVVEDNAINRKLLGAFLNKYGCRNVQYAENGAIAVETVKENAGSFDVIFMDLSMPVMDGFTATRGIRRIEREQKSSRSSSEPFVAAQIIALTGLASDRDEDDAFAAGVDNFITKPVQFDKLTKVLQKREEEISPTV